MFTYIYTREIVNGFFDIDNPLKVDENGNQIFLAMDVDAKFPGKVSSVKSAGYDCCVNFEEELTPEEKAELDQVVADHKNYTPPEEG